MRFSFRWHIRLTNYHLLTSTSVQVVDVCDDKIEMGTRQTAVKGRSYRRNDLFPEGCGGEGTNIKPNARENWILRDPVPFVSASRRPQGTTFPNRSKLPRVEGSILPALPMLRPPFLTTPPQTSVNIFHETSVCFPLVSLRACPPPTLLRMGGKKVGGCWMITRSGTKRG